MEKTNHIAVFKSLEEEQHLVFGEVYAPGIPDTDGDYMDAETIRKMAHDFVRNLKLKKVDVQHNNQLVNGVCVVESFIARKGDPDFIEGAWVIGVHIPDEETWGKVKKGEINGFSIEAMVVRRPMQMEIDIPPVISGRTMKSESHEHEFYVSYDENGGFKGGRTSLVDGHFHEIKRGTATEIANGHSHRFSYIDGLQGLEIVK